LIIARAEQFEANFAQLQIVELVAPIETEKNRERCVFHPSRDRSQMANGKLKD
jgi:hypothetical protein